MSSQFIPAKCLCACAAVIFLSIGHEARYKAQCKRTETVLVLHDSSGPFGWIGGLHGRMLANLMGHFDLPVQVAPVEAYRAGDMGAARAVFYLGSTYDNPLPLAFKQDVAARTKPICW